jgi:hypothetical protein
MEEGRYREGYEAGEEWARERADADELMRLEKLRDRAGDGWDETFSIGGSRAYGVGENFVHLIDPNRGNLRHAAAAFWEEQVGDDYEPSMQDGDFVRGFAEGALAVWVQVKDQL